MILSHDYLEELAELTAHQFLLLLGGDDFAPPIVVGTVKYIIIMSLLDLPLCLLALGSPQYTLLHIDSLLW
jgi:hypothetical protein